MQSTFSYAYNPSEYLFWWRACWRLLPGTERSSVLKEQGCVKPPRWDTRFSLYFTWGSLTFLTLDIFEIKFGLFGAIITSNIFFCPKFSLQSDTVTCTYIKEKSSRSGKLATAAKGQAMWQSVARDKGGCGSLGHITEDSLPRSHSHFPVLVHGCCFFLMLFIKYFSTCKAIY